MPTGRRLLGALAALAAVGLLGACGSSETHAEAPIAAPIEGDRLTTLPLQDFIRGWPEENAILIRDINRLTERCMADRGFSYAGHPIPDERDARVAWRYGPITAADAALGYTPHSEDAPPPLDDHAIVGQGTTYLQAFAGRQTRSEIVSVKDPHGHHIASYYRGGCDGRAELTVYQHWSRIEGMRSTLDDIQGEAYTKAGHDPRVEEAAQHWHRCMAARGYDFEDPEAALDRPWADPPSAGELRTAKADVACKRSSRFAATISAVEAAYERRGLNRFPGLYQDYLDARRTIVAHAAEDLGRHP